MKLRGIVGGLEVMEVDSGASHCFIKEKAINTLGLQISSNGKFGVRLGDGFRSISMGVCKGSDDRNGTNENPSRLLCFFVGYGGYHFRCRLVGNLGGKFILIW